jgi:hypothetical protein
MIPKKPNMKRKKSGRTRATTDYTLTEEKTKNPGTEEL